MVPHIANHDKRDTPPVEDTVILGRLLSLAALPDGYLTPEDRAWYADEIARGVAYVVIESDRAWTLMLCDVPAQAWPKAVAA